MTFGSFGSVATPASGPQYLGKVTTAADFHGLEAVDIALATKKVLFVIETIASRCPVTGQPDFYTGTIEIETAGSSIESKSLKLYLETFRDKGIFAETLAAEITHDVHNALDKAYYAREEFDLHPVVTVVLKQAVRGGISIISTAHIS